MSEGGSDLRAGPRFPRPPWPYSHGRAPRAGPDGGFNRGAAGSVCARPPGGGGVPSPDPLPPGYFSTYQGSIGILMSESTINFQVVSFPATKRNPHGYCLLTLDEVQSAEVAESLGVDLAKVKTFRTPSGLGLVAQPGSHNLQLWVVGKAASTKAIMAAVAEADELDMAGTFEAGSDKERKKATLSL